MPDPSPSRGSLRYTKVITAVNAALLLYVLIRAALTGGGQQPLLVGGIALLLAGAVLGGVLYARRLERGG